MKTPRCLLTLFVAALSIVAGPRFARAQAVLTKLASFNGVNGQYPATGLVLASDGNFYGTTPSGGSGPGVSPVTRGVAYRITPAGVLTPLAGFQGAVTGEQPMAALIQAKDGNLYGTTAGADGLHGSIFKMTLEGEITTLFAFAYDSTTDVYPDGFSPESSLVQGSDGFLYGTTVNGGAANTDNTPGAGTIFKFDPTDGSLVPYAVHGIDGAFPAAPLVELIPGVFYSTSQNAGDVQAGNIYQFTSGFSETPEYTFEGTATDGKSPQGGLAIGADGNLYGTTELAGADNLGTFYRFIPGVGFQELGSFNGAENGAQPFGEMVLATDGNLYGTTSSGGSDSLGTIYRLTTDGVLTTVYTFVSSDGGDPQDGSGPKGTLVQGADGRLYGVTTAGGTNPDGSSSDLGTVFALSLNPVITSATTASGTVGQSFSYQITATNTPTSFVAANVPTGLTISSTGLISGTPTSSGTFNVTLSAKNGMGAGTEALTLTIAPGVPTVTLAATIPSVTAGSGEFAEFTLTLSAAQTDDVAVNYTIKGTAVNGTDYTLIKDSKKIKAGKTSKPIKIVPMGDLDGVTKKTVVLVLDAGEGYTVGTTGKVKVKIVAP